MMLLGKNDLQSDLIFDKHLRNVSRLSQYLFRKMATLNKQKFYLKNKKIWRGKISLNILNSDIFLEGEVYYKLRFFVVCNLFKKKFL